ncbi:MAG: hypothetical protein AAF567_10725 [Actinomycetota bacterium]
MPTTRLSVALRAALVAAVSIIILGLLAGPAWAQEDWDVTPEGLGPIRLGMTIEEVRAELPEPYQMGNQVPIAPDLEGFVISVDGTVHALLPAVESGRVEIIVVLDERYTTAEGIGPRSDVAVAEEAYGNATLTWSAEDQGREKVEFDDQPAGLSFRTSEAIGPQAGIYGSEETTTNLYDPASQLTSIWIMGGGESAEPENTPEEEPADEPEEAPADEPAEEEPAEEEPAEEEPAEEEPAEEEPADEEPSEEEPAEEEPATEPEEEPADALADTGLESTTVALAGASVAFFGLAVGRIGRRLRPWS